MWIERLIGERIKRLAAAFPAVILTGARQTGKTSLVKRLFPEHRYVSLDLRLLAEQAEEAPESFLRDHPPPVVVDEVQYAPGLFRHLKVAIDGDRGRKGAFILTGSQKFTLMRAVSDSLAGRCAVVSLPGLCVEEIRAAGRQPEAAPPGELPARGGFPELWAEPAIPTREFYQSYVSTYLERDLRQIVNVGSLRDFERFLRAGAVRAGQLLNKSNLARDIGVAQTTASHWLSALEAGNQVTLLEPFFANVGKRLVKAPKLYFNDTGLLCFLLGANAGDLGPSPLTGAIWENFVFTELRTWLDLARPDWSLWYYRDQQNREADFLIQGPYESIRLLDAKWTESPRRQAFAQLDKVAAVVGSAPGVARTEVAIAGRMAGVRQLGANRRAVSAYAIADYLRPNDRGPSA